MLKGFKDFIMRGNVMELAIAVIIGSAFTAIVTAVTESLIQPIINSFGGADVDGLAWRIRDGMDSTVIDFGAIITAVINFLIIAAVVYFILVAPLNKLNDMRMRRQGIDPDEAEATETDLLIEIRDLLAAQNATADNQTNAPGTGAAGTEGFGGNGGAGSTGSSGRHAAD
ncbi:MAG TPA: large conductance mechanosensitive channel protein MscL [Candidatus Corynebacterium avicola]|uniref:Large-conductance mechanosensitive channel n=1 Tax=Candidatus Corynebacterium avicola TaxID=2838527 RepID=A0A9D1UKM0_9CORY|nr:large conductance mechanosensitive channel protein MscL [Candidatus Corynebacterium avicola]